MVDLLKRSTAPITDQAWEEIDEAATQVIKAQLSARSLVDFSGPHGWELAAVNQGRLQIPESAKANQEVSWGVRQNLPLVETRIRFELGQWEIDNISRGCKDAELGNVEEAAKKAAYFEESAVYQGLDEACIKGILPASEQQPVQMPSNVEELPAALGEAIKVLDLAGVGGPYALVLGPDAYFSVKQHVKTGYPLHRSISNLLNGNIHWSPALKGGVVLSTRGGDFEMTVGQDFSIGYAGHDKKSVELFITESFTFKVLNPAAAVELKPA
jgi:uncharacterized linocin/CFP29 family protein